VKTVTLYGYGLRIPSDWQDDTAYAFTAREGALRSVTFKTEPIAAASVDRFIQRTRETFEELGGPTVGPAIRLDNPRWPVRSFEVSYGGIEFIAVAVVELGAQSLVVRAKGKPGYRGAWQVILRSLEPYRARGDADLRYYRVYDLGFETAVAFAVPTAFAFALQSGARRLSCTVGPKAARVFELPLWSSSFDVPPDAAVVVTEPWDVKREIVPAVTDGTSFVLEQGAAAAEAGMARMFWAEARARHETRPPLHAVYADSTSSGARGVWSEIVASIHVEV
jgi:hypothetical protein